MIHKLICEYASVQFSDLSESEQALVELAKDACNKAHAVYSGFYVGAALRLPDGSLFSGNNQENRAFPSGMCAERTLLNYVNANFPQMYPDMMAIAAKNSSEFTDNPVSPCGACLQVISEFEHLWQKELKIILYGKNEIWLIQGVKNLLPMQFANELKGK